MKRLIILLALLPTVVWGQTITDATGDKIHGATVVLTGTGFGSKATAPPLTFDTMETGSFSSLWQNTGGLSVTTEARHDQSTYAATLNMQGSLGEAGNHAYFTVDNAALSERYFVQYWFKLDANFDWGTSTYGGGDENNANIKMFRMWNPSSSVNENFHINAHGYSGSGSVQYNTEFVSNPAGGFFGNSWDWDLDEWHLLQVEYQESSLGGNDGILRVWIDGALQVEDTDIMTREDYADLKRPFIVGLYDAWNDGGTDRDDVYLDDVYADPSWSRIEVGNAPTYGGCDHREIQTPTAWTDTSVTFTFNRGSFADDASGWVYLTDEDGNRSSGFPVAFGLDGSATMIAPSGLSAEGTAPADTAATDMHVSLDLSAAGHVRALFWQDGGSEPDTTGLAWTTAAGTSHDSTMVALLAAPGFAADDSSLTVTWATNGGFGVHHYILQYQADTGSGFGSWATVTDTISAGASSFVWPADYPVPPPRGKLDLRLYGANSDESELTNPALLSSFFFNQASEVFCRFQAVEDTAAYHAGSEAPVTSSTINKVVFNRE